MIFPRYRRAIFFVALVCFASSTRADEPWNYKKEFLHYLTDAVPQLLKGQNKNTGAWGNEPWIVTDQNVIFPLAAAWAIDDAANPYHHNDEVLDAVMLGGDKLIAEQKPNGMWIFRKKD